MPACDARIGFPPAAVHGPGRARRTGRRLRRSRRRSSCCRRRRASTSTRCATSTAPRRCRSPTAVWVRATGSAGPAKLRPSALSGPAPDLRRALGLVEQERVPVRVDERAGVDRTVCAALKRRGRPVEERSRRPAAHRDREALPAGRCLADRVVQQGRVGTLERGGRPDAAGEHPTTGCWSSTLPASSQWQQVGAARLLHRAAGRVGRVRVVLASGAQHERVREVVRERGSGSPPGASALCTRAPPRAGTRSPRRCSWSGSRPAPA